MQKATKQNSSSLEVVLSSFNLQCAHSRALGTGGPSAQQACGNSGSCRNLAVSQDSPRHHSSAPHPDPGSPGGSPPAGLAQGPARTPSPVLFPHLLSEAPGVQGTTLLFLDPHPLLLGQGNSLPAPAGRLNAHEGFYFQGLRGGGWGFTDACV